MKFSVTVKALAVGIAAAVSFAASAVPVISQSSVIADQDKLSRKVKIEYQLTGEPGIVTIDIQTNVSEGVWASIGGEHYQTMYGAVNRINTNVTTKSYAYWHPDVDWGANDPAMVNVRVVVTAWSTNSPPDYMVVDLTAKSNLLFYANVESLPGGVGDMKYKTDWLVMRKVPAKGVIWRMGSPATEPNRVTGWDANLEPARLVVLTNDYYLGVYEVTQKQFWNLSDGQSTPSPSLFKDAENADVLPVENVAWATMKGDHGTAGGAASWPENGHYAKVGSKFANLRDKTGLLFDFPTSVQWEYACRAGTSDAFNGGTIGEYAWYDGNCTNVTTNTAMTHPVGTKKANAWGFYDMHGNVAEWVLERPYVPDAEPGVTYEEPTIPVGYSVSSYRTHYMVRGGAYDNDVAHCRSAYCGHMQPTASSSKYGVRLWAPAVIPYK